MSSLRAKGYLKNGHPPDAGPTDADLILAAYQCWGEACPARIIGDFAFVLWDADAVVSSPPASRWGCERSTTG